MYMFVIIIDEKLIFAKRVMIFCSIGRNGLIPLTRTQTSFSIQQKYESFEDILLTLREFPVFLKKGKYQHHPLTNFSRSERAKGLKLSAKTYLYKK